MWADFDTLKAKLKTPEIFDVRNVYDTTLVRGMGFEYWVGIHSISSMCAAVQTNVTHLADTFRGP
jgi:hypothetical protein